ncbi:MAG: nitroreductase family protein [Candidatus Bipolaricaulota bacterium]|nr:MAG: nitroreductase family protein [Candidatus Bipolaricaulota bacterium]
MISNPVIDAMMNRKSIRRFTEEMPSDEIVETLVRAGQQAPFAAQLGSLVVSRDASRHPFHAPLLFTVLVDVCRLEAVIGAHGWSWVTSDAATLLFGLQDACYMTENVIIAAESLGLGSCLLGGTAFRAKAIAEEQGLPPRVFPFVRLAVGYPDEDPPPRPRYPRSASCYEGRYVALEGDALCAAMRVMDDGYLAQDYYRRLNARIPLEDGREDTVPDASYSWTEHMGRKWGQWLRDAEDLLGPLRACGFDLSGGRDPRDEG